MKDREQSPDHRDAKRDFDEAVAEIARERHVTVEEAREIADEALSAAGTPLALEPDMPDRIH